MSVLNIFRALFDYKKDKKFLSETINRDILDLHIRKNFNDFPKVLKNHYSKRRKFVVFTGSTHTREFGEELTNIMKEAGYSVEMKPVNVKIPSIKLSKEIASDCSYRIPIGVGGGSILDLAKLVGNSIGNKSISVPTTLSHDGASSPVASCLHNNERTSKRVLRPSPTYSNLSIIANVPRFNIAGIGEALSNYTAIRDWRNSAYTKNKIKVGYSKWSALMATIGYGYWFRREIGKDKEINENIIDLLIGSHFFSGILMELAGSSAPCSGAEHLLSHALDKEFPEKKSLHGEQVGMFSIASACLQDKWFRDFGILGRDAMKQKKTLDYVNAPTSFKDLDLEDIKQVELEKLFETAKKMGIKKGRDTILNYVEFPDFVLALNKTGIINSFPF